MSELDIEIDPTPELEIEPADLGIEATTETALAPVPLMDVLPADFELPALIKFVPNQALKTAAEHAAAYALSIVVTGPDGLQRADLASQALRTSQKGITDHFAQPTEIANKLHKRLTTLRGEWLADGARALETVGQRIYTESKRLAAITAEERRKQQAEADRLAREAARREAEEAQRLNAPEPVVQQLREQAETATAPPVQTSTGVPVLRGTATVERWKARFIGTPATFEPNPDIDQLTPAQWQQACTLLKAILDGSGPRAAIAINWSYLNKRAGADKSTLAIPGIEAFEIGGTRAKSTRARA